METETLDQGLEQLKKIEAIVDAESQEMNHWYATKDLPARVADVIRHHKDMAVNQMTGAQSFRDDVVVWLRALAMNLEMTGNAGTHAEKAARLRGALELIESLIGKLHQLRFDFQWSHWQTQDLFKSDYPTRHYLERIHELERELKQSQEAQEGKF